MLLDRRFRGRRDPRAATETRSRELGLRLITVNAQAYLALLDVFHGRAAERAPDGASLVRQATTRRGWGSELQALAGYLSLGLVHLARNQLEPGGAPPRSTAA